MSSTWMVWVLLSWLLGNPVLALVVVAALWWLGDRATFRVLPDPLRLFRRGSRMSELRRTLAANPLELGRMRVRKGDAAGALEPLRRLVAERPGTVEGRFWLARALEAQGDGPGAARVREEAWREYAALPRFRRQHERAFAWRIKPWRPALVAAALVVAAVLAYRAIATPPG